MKFGAIPLKAALGACLAYPMHGLKKGARLKAKDIALLAGAGVQQVIAARLNASDIDEEQAALRLARAACGKNIKCVKAAGGRVNLHTRAAGLLLYDPARLARANQTHEACTIAALLPYARAEAGQRIASVKIIPLGLPRADFVRVEKRASALFALHPFRPLRAALIHTHLPNTKASLRKKAETITRARLASVGGQLAASALSAHETSALAQALSQHKKADIVLVHSAQAIIDRRDIVPLALKAAGGKIIHFGMPVEPGNLLLFGELNGAPVIGLPGCARSPKRNGLDWVLERLAAGLTLRKNDIMAMGAGGLLE